jgi:proline racemase
VAELEGATILEKRRFAAESIDHVRQLLINEPRGHADMYGCFVTEPNDEGADLGVVFFHNAGYSTACGHGTIALVTWAIDSGAIEAREPETRVVVDVPSGRLETVARVCEGRVRSVRFTNVPAYVAAAGIPMTSCAGRPPTADVSFGGAFYASVDAVAAGLSVEPANVGRFIELGREIKHELEAAREFVDPLEPELNGIYGVIFFQEEERIGGHALVQRNVTVFADGEVDRSPCGSGTSARLALLHRDGRIGVGETLLHRSIVSTEFTGSALAEMRVGERAALITTVEGAAHKTGEHRFELDADDPVGNGFLMR